MQKKEIFDLVAEYVNEGLSANEIRDRATTWLDKNTLEALWSTPRKNINIFIEGCLSNLALKPPFLDLGCGRRSLKPEVLQKYGDQTTFIGVDHFLPPREENDPRRLPDIIARAEAIPLKNDSVGTVFCMELLEHVPDEMVVLSEISRVMYPDSHLLLSLPGLGIPRHEKLPFQRDYRRISVEQTENLLRNHGFRSIEVDTKELGSLQTNIFVIASR